MIIKAKLDQPEKRMVTKINNDICFARKRRSSVLQNSSSVTITATEVRKWAIMKNQQKLLFSLSISLKLDIHN